MLLLRLLLAKAFVVISFFSYAQTIDSVSIALQEIPDKYFSKVDEKLRLTDERLTKKSMKYLKKLEKQEKQLERKLQQADPEAAANLFQETGNKYSEFAGALKNKTERISRFAGGQYDSYLDTLGTSLSFLKQFKDLNGKAQLPLKNLGELKAKFQQANKINEYISQRKQQVKEIFSKYSKLPQGLKKQFDKINKTAYYYSAQVREYKEMLKDPSKAERKALALLNKLPAFQKFMQKNSQLASMFRMPDNSGAQQSLAGLQTRASTQSLIQSRIGPAGANARQLMQQNISQAQNELNKLKDKVGKFGGSSSNVEIPDFKPNSQKTKTFLERLEYGANLQFAKSSNLFPSSTNLGLSLGYKLNDKSILGVGLSYNMGMGSIKHIVISHEGIGLRSFADYKLKGLLFASSGYEMNYNARFKNIAQLKEASAWQKSALIGVSKKYSINKKVQGEIKLLYDFLANIHVPVTQPLVFRLGYKF